MKFRIAWQNAELISLTYGLVSNPTEVEDGDTFDANSMDMTDSTLVVEADWDITEEYVCQDAWDGEGERVAYDFEFKPMSYATSYGKDWLLNGLTVSGEFCVATITPI